MLALVANANRGAGRCSRRRPPALTERVHPAAGRDEDASAAGGGGGEMGGATVQGTAQVTQFCVASIPALTSPSRERLHLLRGLGRVPPQRAGTSEHDPLNAAATRLGSSPRKKWEAPRSFPPCDRGAYLPSLCSSAAGGARCERVSKRLPVDVTARSAGRAARCRIAAGSNRDSGWPAGRGIDITYRGEACDHGQDHRDDRAKRSSAAVSCLALLGRPVKLDLGARVLSIAALYVLLLNLHVDLGPMHRDV
jgi:hypothetical protein